MCYIVVTICVERICGVFDPGLVVLLLCVASWVLNITLHCNVISYLQVACVAVQTFLEC